MRHFLSATLAVVISTASGAMAQAQPAAAGPTRPVNGCTIFDPVDISKLPKIDPAEGPLVGKDLARRHADWRPTPGADAEIAVDSTDPMSGGRTTTLAERAAGVWRVSAASNSGRDPALTTKQVIFDATQTAALDRLVGDSCLWGTPPLLPNDVPLKNGGVAVCDDGMNTAYHIRVGAKHWDGQQQCRVIGLPGQVAVILWKATLPPHISGSFRTTRPPPTPPDKP